MEGEHSVGKSEETTQEVKDNSLENTISEAEAEAEETLVEANIRFTSGDKNYALKIHHDIPIQDLKAKIIKEAGVESGKTVRLILKGQLLKDDKKLTDYKFESGHTMHAAVSNAPPAASAPVLTPAPAPTQPASGNFPLPTPAPAAQPVATDPISLAIAQITSQPAPTARGALSTLSKIIQNIIDNPMEDKYRSIKRSNAAFQKKIGSIPGGEAIMIAMGFSDPGTGCWTLTPSEAAWNTITSAQSKIKARLDSLPAAAAAAPPPIPAPAPTMPGLGSLGGGMPGMGGLGGGMGGMPDMAQMLQNPEMLRQAMNNPMVRQMMQGNPQMQQQMDMLMQNPGMLAQAADMMRNNPQMVDQAMRMAGQQGGGLPGGGMPSTSPFPTPPLGTPAPAPSATQQAANGPQQQQEPEMTEEQMIEEAIRRSLQES
mmetsp:Transcript_38756/g.51063  ORF Transcript_38756/g.51063 Transcript_38756/m.51063 type:complete len:428 (-) Transcript_38756:224-1507(-)